MVLAMYECMKLAVWEHCAVSFLCVSKLGSDKLGIGAWKLAK